MTTHTSPAELTVRDGHSTAYRDYWNPLFVQEPGADFTEGVR